MTVRLPSGSRAEIGDRVFHGPDFYARLVDADETHIIVEDDPGDLILMRWEPERTTYSEAADGPVRGCYVLVAMDSDSKWGIDR